MTLDVRVLGDPEALRASATALAGTGKALQNTGDAVARGRNDSEELWTGDAGDGFRRSMLTTVKATDSIAEDHAGMCRALQNHAGDLDTIERRMQDARHIAGEAGLPVTADAIGDPGPPPPAAGPAPLPSVVPAGAPQEAFRQAREVDQQALTRHQGALAAEQDWARRNAAFTECTQVVAQARTDQASSQARLARFLGGIWEKAPFNVADVLTGTGGALAARTSAYRTIATDIEKSGKIDRALRLTNSPHLNQHYRAQANRIHATNVVNAAYARAKAVETVPARLVDALPDQEKGWLTRGLMRDDPPKGATPGTAARIGRSVASRLPVAGLLITAGGVGYDVLTGKDPTTSVVSGLGGYVAGAAAGAIAVTVGAPVLAVVGAGFIASVGVGFLIEEAMS